VRVKVFELKPFQVPGYKKLVSQLRHLLLYKMGLGKTVVCTKAMYDVGAKCVLILCPKNAIRVWEDHICEWFEGLDAASGKDTWFAIHRWRGKYNQTEKRRAKFRVHTPECVNVYITTFAAFISDIDVMSTHKYDLIIIDEAKRIRGRDGKAFNLLKPLAKRCKWLWQLTGTPGKLPGDFFTMFHLLDPKYFSSYWKFVQAFCYTQKNEWGQFEVLGLKNKDAWYQLLDNKATILTKADVGHQETVRQVLHVDMDPDQERIYREVEEDMFSISNDQVIIAQTHMTKVLRYRQLLCCPKILDPNLGIGSAFEDYVETIKNDTDPHTVVFTPFTAAIPFFVQHLNAHKFNNVFVLSGGLNPDELHRRISEWRRTKGQIICSILYATAFSLEPATECFFIGYEWDPEDNAQAEDRLNRLTTKEQVNAYYYAYNNTYTSEHLQILTTKQRQIQLTTGTSRATKI